MEITNGKRDSSLCAPPPSHATMAEKQEIFNIECLQIFLMNHTPQMTNQPVFLRSRSERKFAVE